MKDKSYMILISVCALFVLIFLFLCITFFLFYDGSKFSNETQDWINFATIVGGVLGPFLSFFTLLITGWIAFEFNEYQKKKNDEKDQDDRRQTIIKMYQEFRTEHMMTARNISREIWEQWAKNSDDGFLKFFALQMVSEKPADYNGIKVEGKHIRAVYDLFSFYNVLSLYSQNQDNLKDHRYFYYGWWRSFLYKIAFHYDQYREKIFCPGDFDQGVKADFMTAQRLTSTLKRLDKLCGFDRLEDTASGDTIKEFYINTDYVRHLLSEEDLPAASGPTPSAQ